MRFSPEVIEAFARMGSKGGKARSEAKTAAARRNIRKRWKEYRKNKKL